MNALKAGDRITRVTRIAWESAGKANPILIHTTVDHAWFSNPIDEGIWWIRGTHASDSIEARALLAAWALVYA